MLSRVLSRVKIGKDNPLTTAEVKLITEHVGWIKEWARRLWNRTPLLTVMSLDDAIQYAFLAAAVAAREFDPTRGFKFTTFLSRVIWDRLTHAAEVHALENIKIMQKTEREGLKRVGSNETKVKPVSLGRHTVNLGEDLDRLVDNLPSQYREVIRMRFFESMPIGEIAKIMHVERHAVTARIRRACAKLRGQIEKDL